MAPCGTDRLPIMPPSTGMKISAMNSDAVSTQITVIGRYFMNWPTMPGQTRSGMKTISVVMVDEMIGQAMRCAPMR